MANKKKENPLVRVTVSLDPSDYRVFEKLAAQEDRSTAYLIRQAMREFLRTHQADRSPRSSKHLSASGRGT